jgi:hypothetical protein
MPLTCPMFLDKMERGPILSTTTSYHALKMRASGDSGFTI